MYNVCCVFFVLIIIIIIIIVVVVVVVVVGVVGVVVVVVVLLLLLLLVVVVVVVVVVASTLLMIFILSTSMSMMISTLMYHASRPRAWRPGSSEGCGCPAPAQPFRTRNPRGKNYKFLSGVRPKLGSISPGCHTSYIWPRATLQGGRPHAIAFSPCQRV